LIGWNPRAGWPKARACTPRRIVPNLSQAGADSEEAMGALRFATCKLADRQPTQLLNIMLVAKCNHPQHRIAAPANKPTETRHAQDLGKEHLVKCSEGHVRDR
jgi:hypothetical protein